MSDRLKTADRMLESARALRAVVEETHRALQASRELVSRSQLQSTRLSLPQAALATLDLTDASPSKRLVDGLIQAYEAAQTDNDARTRSLLHELLHHVGTRIASIMESNARRGLLH